MRKHLKDKKVILYKSVADVGSGGFYVTKWKPIHPGRLWAYTRQLSAKEFYAAAVHQYQEERLFIINWRDDVEPGMAIRYGDKWYSIVRIDPYEDYKGDLKLSVKEISGEVKADSVLPYE